MRNCDAAFTNSTVPPQQRSSDPPQCSIRRQAPGRSNALTTTLFLALTATTAWSDPPRFAIAPAGNPFPVQDPVAGDPGETARHFVQEHAAVLGLTSPNITLGIASVRPRGQETLVHLREVYSGVSIVATDIIVQVNASNTIDLLINGILPDTITLDQGGLSLTPDVTSTQALDYALLQLAPDVPPQEVTVSEAQLRIFDARILDLEEPPRLVWDFTFDAGDDRPEAAHHCLIDAHALAIVRAYTLVEHALHRKIYDANSQHNSGSLVRDEGDPACGRPDADSVYSTLQDTYDYFLTMFARDSFDDGGQTIKATVYYCNTNDPNDCPYPNAFQRSYNHRLYFGQGMVGDDVVAHEYTHNVTKFESGLLYENAPGAINESLSDIFGEVIDLENGAGTDTAAVRWLMGEDCTTTGGASRSMSDPNTAPPGPYGYACPDRMSNSNYVPAVSNPNDNNDYGGVHTNSGVSNKLFYLLSDGDWFNGYTIEAEGLDTAADLFYYANTRYLSAHSNFYSLFDCLNDSAVYRGWSAHSRNNLYYACKAVEIALENHVYVDTGATGLHGLGFSNLPYNTVTEGVSAARPGDRLLIRAGNYQENLRIDEHLTLTTWEPNTTVSIGTH